MRALLFWFSILHTKNFGFYLQVEFRICLQFKRLFWCDFVTTIVSFDLFASKVCSLNHLVSIPVISVVQDLIWLSLVGVCGASC